MASLIEAVKNGEDIRIAAGGSYSFPVDNVEYDVAESVVGAMSIWSVSNTIKVVGRTKIQTFQVQTIVNSARGVTTILNYPLGQIIVNHTLRH